MNRGDRLDELLMESLFLVRVVCVSVCPCVFASLSVFF